MAQAIEREWTARAEGTVTVNEITSDELLGGAVSRLGADVVVYPSALLGSFAMRHWLAPIEDEQLDDPRMARRDIFPLQRLREVAWGKRIFAVPFGSPQLTILLRRDLMTKRHLLLPATWSEYHELAEQLSANSTETPDDVAWRAVAEPLADGWAGKVLLARAACYARHRSQYSTLFDARSMDPLIAGPPFVHALTELAKTARLGPKDQTSLDPAAVRAGFAAGKYGMALSWPTRADVPVVANGEVPFAVDFAELPGSDQVYNFRVENWEAKQESKETRVSLLGVAGRLGSVTRECRRVQAAMNMLYWLSGIEMGQDVAPGSSATTLYRESHVATVARWLPPGLDAEAGQAYAETVRAAQSRDIWLSSLRIPGSARYLQALDKAVQTVVDEGAEPAVALGQAAEEWTAITAELGLEAQQAAYLKSIGLE